MWCNNVPTYHHNSQLQRSEIKAINDRRITFASPPGRSNNEPSHFLTDSKPLARNKRNVLGKAKINNFWKKEILSSQEIIRQTLENSFAIKHEKFVPKLIRMSGKVCKAGQTRKLLYIFYNPGEIMDL